MSPETKAAMERLAGMTWTLKPFSAMPNTLFIIDGNFILGRMGMEEAAKLGLKPGMTIAIYPVGMDGEEKTDDKD